MSNDKIGTKHLTHRPRDPEGERGVEFDRHSEPWEVMKLLYDGLRQITELDNCYNHAPGKTPEDSIANEEVECMIRNLMPEKDIEYTLRFTVRAKSTEAVGGAMLKDALHGLLTEARNAYIKQACKPVEPEPEEEEYKPTCKPRCHECGYTMGKDDGLAQLTVDGFEYHKVCWDKENNL